MLKKYLIIFVFLDIDFILILFIFIVIYLFSNLSNFSFPSLFVFQFNVDDCQHKTNKQINFMALMMFIINIQLPQMSFRYFSIVEDCCFTDWFLLTPFKWPKQKKKLISSYFSWNLWEFFLAWSQYFWYIWQTNNSLEEFVCKSLYYYEEL